MRLLKIWISFCSILFIGNIAVAQQQEHFSMYMQDNYIINPAEGGTEDFTDLKAGYRTQWLNYGAGNAGGPKTFFLSGHTPIGKHETDIADVKQLPFHGVGGVFIADNIGPFSVISAKSGYAYHLPVYKDLIISLGTFVGVKQYGISDNYLQSSSDPSAVDPLLNFKPTIVPDMTIGLWGYSKSYYFGFASFQIVNSDIEFYKDLDQGTSEDAKARLRAHHWLTAGYKVDINENWFVVPSFVFKFVRNAPVTFDLNAKIRFQDEFWVGGSYRYLDAVVLLAGLTLFKKIDLGYAYDITTSEVGEFSSGSHEIVIGYRLPNHQHKRPPAQFW